MRKLAAPMPRLGSRAAAPSPVVATREPVVARPQAGILPRRPFEDLDVEPRGEAPVQLARKGSRRRKRPKPRTAPVGPAAADPEDRTMSFRDLPPGPVRAYRMEASTQQYDESGRPKWAHVHVNPRNDSHLYLPKPKENYSSPGRRYGSEAPRARQRSQPRGMARDSQAYAEEFLKNERDTGRNTMFVNFGVPKRALELYRQKRANEPHLNFTIKSTLVPQSTFAELRAQTVHEADAKKFPTRPFNVDRKAPNQLGLRERHIDLLNSTAISGSARVENIAALERKYGRALDAAAPRQPREPVEEHRGRHRRKGKRIRGRSLRSLSHLHDPMEEEDEDDLAELPRPRERRLGDFFSAEDQERFGYDPES